MYEVAFAMNHKKKISLGGQSFRGAEVSKFHRLNTAAAK